MLDGLIEKAVAYQNITYSCSVKKKKEGDKLANLLSVNWVCALMKCFGLTKLFVYIVVIHRKRDFLLLYEQLGLVL